jgi:hypothetical protein
MKWVVVFLLAGGEPVALSDVQGAAVHVRYYAEFTTREACIDWLGAIWDSDLVPVIYAYPEPCSVAAESLPSPPVLPLR